jgi:tripeptidyl-peptidase-2
MRLQFRPAEVKRFFLSVPKGATWMDITVRDRRQDADASSRLIVLHTIQLLPHAAYRDAESQKYFQMLPSQSTVSSVRVHSGVTCEVDLARYWSAIGSTKIYVRIEFRGVRALPDKVQLSAGCGGECMRVFSDLRDESINPTAKLTTWKSPIRPKSDGVISPLGERDVFPITEKRIFQLVMTYEFSQEEAGSFTPRCPALQGVLYESAYESQMMLVFDGNKKLLGVGDSWPSEVKVPKGSITIRLQVRHDEQEMLEKLKDMPIWIERKMEKEIALSVYSSKEAMMTGKANFKKRTLRKGTSASIFFAEPPSSKLPSACNAGDVLAGTAYFGSGDASLPGDGKRPGGFAITYVVGPKPPKAPEAATPEPTDERTAEYKMEEAVRDLKVEHLSKLTAKEKEAGKFELLHDKLLTEYPDHIPLFVAALKHVDTDFREEAAPKVIEAADKIVTAISEDELALHFGKGYDKDDPAETKVSHQIAALVCFGRFAYSCIISYRYFL